MNSINELKLPCLKGQMGDWVYYISLLSFKEVAKRVKLPKEIDLKYKNQETLKLGDWIQREIAQKRIDDVVNYLKEQEQHFFNSLILGMYDGKPKWSEINVTASGIYDDEENLDYFSKTFGILTLTGQESIFAIDGQHRARSIRQAVIDNPKLEKDEICTIFIAHKTDELGKIRTRRLFSTLNRYAKPVNKKEIIVLSEDDNSAILTRKLVEEYPPFANKILISGNKSVSPTAQNFFTSIISLYEIVEVLMTNKSIPGIGKSSGKDRSRYTTTRISDSDLEHDFQYLTQVLDELISRIPALTVFFIENKTINRNNLNSSLLYRPVGQKILFDVYKGVSDLDKKEVFFEFFKKDDFNLEHRVWNTIFWNQETQTMNTDPSRQKFASLLIMEKLGISVKRTKKDLEVSDNFTFSSIDI